MRPHPRRARTDPRSPRAWATSDRNGHISNHENLCWQFDWAGTGLVNKRILVSEDELDKPQRQLGTLIIPPDPVAIRNARPEQYYIDEYAGILFEVPRAGNLVGGYEDGGGFAGYQPGRAGPQPATAGIYAENSTPGNTVPLALELGQYFATDPTTEA